jgi:hypothetical protein
MQTSTSLFQIEERSAGVDTRIKRGGIGRYDLLIRYGGDRDQAIVNYWLEADDRNAELLLSCYRFDPEILDISSGSFKSVSLIFQVPSQAALGYYSYTLFVESAQHPGELAKRHLQIQVTTADEDASGDLNPIFTLEPVTTSGQPYLLSSDNPLAITIQIENRSKRADRFFITCPDLEDDWFSIKYPDSAIESLGLVRELDGLPLNPTSKGSIQLLIQPPQYAIAGNYFPTLQVTSRNQPNLLLLDVIYFQIPVDESLQLRLSPNTRHLPVEPGEFSLEVQNTGNIPRSLGLRGSDREQLFNYTFHPSSLQLEPGIPSQVQLLVAPKKWWKRPLRGQGIEVPFELGLDNIVDSSEKHYELPAIPDVLPQGQVLWKAHSKWVLWCLTVLPLILLALLILSALTAALWLWITRPEPPKITQFEAIKLDYKEGKTPPIRLNWKVSNLQQVGRITITRLENGVETYNKNYTFNGDIQTQLRQRYGPADLKKENNHCEATPVKPFSTGWIFEWSRRSTPGLPSWIPIKERIAPMDLSCTGIITDGKTSGEYTFQIQVFQKSKEKEAQSKDPIATQKADSVLVKLADEPQITELAATQPLYQEPSKLSPDSAADKKEGIVRLNWKIANFSQVRELKLVSLAPNGTAQGEAKTYLFTNSQIPPELAKFCRLENSGLSCQNFPTDARKPGDYLFKLTLGIPQLLGSRKELARISDPIKIQPRPLRINKLMIQVGDSALSDAPKQIFKVGEVGLVLDTTVNWEVDGGDGTKVELLPAPGTVDLSGTEKLKFAAPGSESIVLRVSNASGEQQSRTIVIQTIVPPEEASAPTIIMPLMPPSGASTGTSNSSGNPTAPNDSKPENPNELEPIEVPPRP